MGYDIFIANKVKVDKVVCIISSVLYSWVYWARYTEGKNAAQGFCLPCDTDRGVLHTQATWKIHRHGC